MKLQILKHNRDDNQKFFKNPTELKKIWKKEEKKKFTRHWESRKKLAKERARAQTLQATSGIGSIKCRYFEERMTMGAIHGARETGKWAITARRWKNETTPLIQIPPRASCEGPWDRNARHPIRPAKVSWDTKRKNTYWTKCLDRKRKKTTEILTVEVLGHGEWCQSYPT